MKAKRKKNNGKSEEIMIPGKLYFRIGEVSELCKLPAYVLRFWESEFPQLRPGKSSTGQRLYRRKDVENVVKIRRLLYEEGYTISGARQILKSESKTGRPQPSLPFNLSPHSGENLRDIRNELQAVLGMLSTKR
ncbi:MAG TPA: MerR family transcriptional regulator [Terriglobales bacterium]